MKFLKNYLKFNEENDFDVKETDAVDLKASKETLQTVNKNLKEFKSKKSIIDNLFKNTKDEKILQTEVDKLIGSDKDKRNPFIVNYLQVAQDQKRLDNLVIDISDKKINIEQFKTLINTSSDPAQKVKLQQSIDDINKKISDSNISISTLKKDIDSNSKRINDEMLKVGNDIEGKIKNIENTRK